MDFFSSENLDFFSLSAAATHSDPYKPFLTIWLKPKIPTINKNRIKYIDYIFNNEKQFTSKGAEIDSLNLKIYTKKDYYSYFNNLEIKDIEEIIS